MTLTRDKSPAQIAQEIVQWFPDSTFTYDTFRKLQRNIAHAIEAERKPIDAQPTNNADSRRLVELDDERVKRKETQLRAWHKMA